MYQLARPRLSERGCLCPNNPLPGRAVSPPPHGTGLGNRWGRFAGRPVPAESPAAPGRGLVPPGVARGQHPDSLPVLPGLPPAFPRPLSPYPPARRFGRAGPILRPAGLVGVSPPWGCCPVAGTKFWGVLGGVEPFQAGPPPWEVSFGGVPADDDPARAVHPPYRRCCQGYRPNGLCRRGRILSRLPTPKPSCRGHREPAASYHLVRAPRSKGQRSGHGVLAGRIQLPPLLPSPFRWEKGPWGWAPPHSSSPPPPELEPFPTYCFISGPADKYSSIPRGGREVPNNGPASRWPRCAVYTPPPTSPGLGGCQRPPRCRDGTGTPAEESCTPNSSLGDPC